MNALCGAEIGLDQKNIYKLSLLCRANERGTSPAAGLSPASFRRWPTLAMAELTNVGARRLHLSTSSCPGPGTTRPPGGTPGRSRSAPSIPHTTGRSPASPSGEIRFAVPGRPVRARTQHRPQCQGPPRAFDATCGARDRHRAHRPHRIRVDDLQRALQPRPPVRLLAGNRPASTPTPTAFMRSITWSRLRRARRAYPAAHAAGQSRAGPGRGSSDDGRNFAARCAEAIFTAQQELGEAREFYTDVNKRALLAGRDPAAVNVLPGLSPFLGSTMAEAKARDTGGRPAPSVGPVRRHRPQRLSARRTGAARRHTGAARGPGRPEPLPRHRQYGDAGKLTLRRLARRTRTSRARVW